MKGVIPINLENRERRNGNIWPLRQRSEVDKNGDYFQQLVQNADAIIVQIDLAGRLLFMNDWGLRFLGKTEQDMAGKFFLDAIFSDVCLAGGVAQSDLLSAVSAAKGIPAICICEIGKGNGEHTWIEWHTRLIRDEQGNASQIVAIGFDHAPIRREVQTAYLADEGKMQNLFDNMIHAGLYCKLLPGELGQPDDYEVVAVNKAFRSMFMVRQSADCKQRIKEVFTEIQAERADWRDMIRRIAIDGMAVVFEQYFTRKKAWYSISLYSPEKDYFVVCFENITKNKLLAAEKERIWGRYEALVQQSFDAIILVDPTSHTIVEVNQRLCQMTGYNTEELIGLDLGYILLSDANEVNLCQEELLQRQFVPPALRKVRCKGGSFFETERVATMIAYQGRILELITLHDISEERKLQQKINEDVYLAGSFQRQMLPPDLSNEFVEVKNIYHPLRVVSGDFFDYCLSKDGSQLTGYLVDVAGHGLATALETAAINVFLKNQMLEGQAPTDRQLKKINDEMISHFKEGTFAALIFYHFDFAAGMLTCAFCGINWFLASCTQKQGWIKRKGSFMGVFHHAEFDIVKIPLVPGDCFYFLTDGFSDWFPEAKVRYLSDFEASTQFLTDLTKHETMDDCSAICVKIRGLRDHYQFHFNGISDVSGLHERIRQILELWAPMQVGRLEIVANEAINNVLLHGSGHGYIRLRRVEGRHIIMRIKDSKEGSTAGHILCQYDAQAPEDLLQTMKTEGGRGILLMKQLTDRICYSRDGSEILLVSRIE